MKELPNPQDYHQTPSDLIAPYALFLLCCIPKPFFVSGFLYPQTNLYTHEVCFSFALYCESTTGEALYIAKRKTLEARPVQL